MALCLPSTGRTTQRGGREQGVILIQVAVAGLVLIAFSAFVIDHGVMWVSRQQAQNAADAGAIAGAMARTYDDTSSPPIAGGLAELSASQVAVANLVWFAPPTAVVSFTCPADIVDGRCARVDVYRNGEFGSTALPTFFGAALSLTSQGVRATATAQAIGGNATNCLKPWAIPDKWTEASAPLDTTFVRYLDGGGGALVANPDVYGPPDEAGPGTGMTLTADGRTPLTLKFGDLASTEPVSRGWYVPLDLPGTNTYYQNISGCNGRMLGFGQQIPASTTATHGLTTAEMAALISLDSGASWNTTTDSVEGSCAPTCAAVSPRIVPVAVFDVDRLQYRRATSDWSGCPGGMPCVDVVNIVGFFIESIDGSGDAGGYLTTYPGLMSAGPRIALQSSFLMAATLVR